METLYTQSMLFGYCVGNPGLVKVLFITEPQPTKSHCNFTHQMKISKTIENLIVNILFSTFFAFLLGDVIN